MGEKRRKLRAMDMRRKFCKIALLRVIGGGREIEVMERERPQHN